MRLADPILKLFQITKAYVVYIGYVNYCRKILKNFDVN